MRGRRRQEKATDAAYFSGCADSHISLFIQKVTQAAGDSKCLSVSEGSVTVKTEAVEIAKDRLRATCQEALGHAFMALEPLIRRTNPAPTDLASEATKNAWVAMLHFLKDALVFKPEATSLAHHLTRLSKQQGGPASLEKLRHMAQASRLYLQLIDACNTKEQADSYLAHRRIDRDTLRKWRAKVADEMKDPLVFALLKGPAVIYPRAKNLGQVRASLVRDLRKAHDNAMSLERRRRPGHEL